MFIEMALPAVPELSVDCTPGIRRMTSPILVAPVYSIFSFLITLRAPAKVLTLSCRPVPSQLPLTWIVSSIFGVPGSVVEDVTSCANPVRTINSVNVAAVRHGVNLE